MHHKVAPGIKSLSWHQGTIMCHKEQPMLHPRLQRWLDATPVPKYEKTFCLRCGREELIQSEGRKCPVCPDRGDNELPIDREYGVNAKTAW